MSAHARQVGCVGPNSGEGYGASYRNGVGAWPPDAEAIGLSATKPPGRGLEGRNGKKRRRGKVPIPVIPSLSPFRRLPRAQPDGYSLGLSSGKVRRSLRESLLDTEPRASYTIDGFNYIKSFRAG